jgi:hypothetical protein
MIENISLNLIIDKIKELIHNFFVNFIYSCMKGI